MFRKLFPTRAMRLADELDTNLYLLQQARVHVETSRHNLRTAESLVTMLEERVERQQNEVLVEHHQEQCAADLKRVVTLKKVDTGGNHAISN